VQPASTPSTDPTTAARLALRTRLQALRDELAADGRAADATLAIAPHLNRLLESLGPEQLGLYWPVRSEFNAAGLCLADKGLDEIPFALPYSRRTPCAMEYRAWDRREPTLRDECGIASAAGRAVVPDVVLAPCLGFTRSGFRIGYGGGYFDRWLALHPHVTAIGLAWSATEVDEAEFTPAPHDVPMIAILTERGVLGG
jgi:5,10-methenyltetrahydrofolate synthetase